MSATDPSAGAGITRGDVRARHSARRVTAAATANVPSNLTAFWMSTMTHVTTAIATSSASPPVAPARPAARTKMLLEAPILSTLLRLSAPNILNLLALAGMITFDALFLGRLGADALAGVSLAFPFVMLMQ